MHKHCANCKTRIPIAVGVCPFCGTRQPDPRPVVAEAQEARRSSSQGRNTQPFPGITAEDIAAAGEPSTQPRPAPRALRDRRFAAGRVVKPKKTPRWPWVLVLFAAVAAGYWYLKIRPRPLPTASLQAATEGLGEPCQNATWCVVVYVAPWDPASDRSMGTIARLAATLADTDMGLAVIVGADEPDEMQAMADAVAADAWLDPTGSVPRALSLTTSPSWLLLDARRRVKRVVPGTHFPFESHLGKLGLGQLQPADPPPGTDDT